MGNRSPADLFTFGPVIFGRSQGDEVDILDIFEIEPQDTPRFERGLNLEDAPPPDISSCS